MKPKIVDSSLATVKTYPALVRCVQEELQGLELLVKRRTVETYWTVGRYIHEHLLEHKDRAEYGKQLLQRLGKDIDRDETTLLRCLQFFRAYPIPASWQELSWSHYRALMTVKDKDERKKLAKEAVQKKWDVERLQAKVKHEKKYKNLSGDSLSVVPQLSFTRGRLNIRRVTAFPGHTRLLLDLGFHVFCGIKEGVGAGLQKDDLVLLGTQGSAPRLPKTEAPLEVIYTYTAGVLKVIDGDTQDVLIDLGMDDLTAHRLRLRGIDCPEADTPEGQKAKRFVQTRLKDCPFIVVKTHKDTTDKYARYLADVFYIPHETDPVKVAAEGRYLNQELLDAGLAVLYG